MIGVIRRNNMQITDTHLSALKFFIKSADDYLITHNKETNSINDMQKYTQILLNKIALTDLLKGIEKELEK